MGHTYVDVKLTSPITGEDISINALVDTGATTTTIPKDLAERLNLPQITRRSVVTASGREDMPVSYAIIDISGEKTVTDLLISTKLNRVLIGVTTLESLAFKVNPKTGKLEKSEVLLLLQKLGASPDPYTFVILSPSLCVILREQGDRRISLRTGSAKNLVAAGFIPARYNCSAEACPRL